MKPIQLLTRCIIGLLWFPFFCVSVLLIFLTFNLYQLAVGRKLKSIGEFTHYLQGL